MKKTKHGFTLVELIIVIAVIGVLAAILIPTFANVIDKANAKSALSDARNLIEQMITEMPDNPDMPKTVVIFVKKAGSYHLFGYDFDGEGRIKISNGNPYRDYESTKSVFDDYSLNSKAGFDEDAPVFDEDGYDLVEDKVAFYLVPKDARDSIAQNQGIKGIHGTKNAELDANYTNMQDYMTESMGDDVEAYHGVLLPGTWGYESTGNGVGADITSSESGSTGGNEGGDTGDDTGDDDIDAPPGAIPEDGKFQLTISVYPSDAGTVEVKDVTLEDGAARIEANSMVTATFTKAEAYEYDFSGWYINGEQKSTELEYTFKMNSDKDIVAVCDVPAWNGTDTEEPQGEGTAENPYVIMNAAQLKYVQVQVNGGPEKAAYQGAYICLGADIYLNSNVLQKVEGGNTAKLNVWTPIGKSSTYSFTCHFSGEYEGKKHTVYGMYINGSSTYQGLFGYVKTTADIHDLTVADSYVKAGDYTGGVIGYINASGNINNVTFQGKIECSKAKCGGIVGYITTTECNIKGCKAFGTINNTYGTSAVGTGGIVGSATKTSSISDCENNMDITTASSYAGGIAGGISTTATAFENCINFGDITRTGTGSYTGGICGYSSVNSTYTNCENYGVIKSGGSYVAGICGGSGKYITSFTRCANYANVSGKGYVAGIMGYSNTATASAKNSFIDCANLGDISGTSTYVAGIAGKTYARSSSYKAEFTNCYNSGNVETTSTSTSPYIAGISAYSSANQTFTNCYNSGKITYASTGTVNYYGAIRSNKVTPTETNTHVLEGCCAAIGSAEDHDAAWFKSDGAVTTLGEAYNTDSKNLNGGYPILDWQGGKTPSAQPGPGDGGDPITPKLYMLKYMDGTTIIQKELVKPGTKKTIIADLEDHDEFRFLYWQCGQNHYHGGDKFTMPESDLTINAVWKDYGEGNRYYKLTYYNSSDDAVIYKEEGAKPVGTTFTVPDIITSADGTKYVPTSPKPGHVFEIENHHNNIFDVTCVAKELYDKFHIISTPEDFLKIGVDPDWKLTDDYFVVNDIDFSGVEISSSIGFIKAEPDYINGGYKPYGDSFTGEFYGNGYAFKNVAFTNTIYNGLFFENKGNIHDLYIKDLDTEAGGYFGTIAVQNIGTISRCGVTGSINIPAGYWYNGGLVGFNKGTIDQCWTNVNMTTSSSTAYYYGGIVGQLSSGGILSNSFAFGTVTGSKSGGLVGEVANTVTIQNCYSMCRLAKADSFTKHIWGNSYNNTQYVNCTGLFFQRGLREDTQYGYQDRWEGSSYNNPNHANAYGCGLNSDQWTEERLTGYGWDSAIWDFTGDWPTLKNNDPADYGIEVKPPVTPRS